MIGGKVQLDLTPAEQLRKSGIRKAMRIGLNRASAPVKASVVSHAEAVKRFGYLAKSIRIRQRIYPGDKFVSVVGPSTKFTRQPRGKYTRGEKKGEKRAKAIPAKYAHLVERGTERSRAKPWLKPAHDESKGPFLDQVGTEIGREIDAELKRHPPKGT